MARKSFPLFLSLHDRPVLIAGGGEAMLRKARLVAPFGARLVVAHPTPLADLAALAHTRLPRLAGPEELEGVALAFLDPEADSTPALAAAARRRGIPVNVPDKPDLSSFIMPAIIDRDPITVAISSGGAAPVLLRRLRERLEAVLEPNLGALARFMDGFRPAVKASRPGDETARRRFWEAVVDGPVAARLLAGDEAGAQTAMARALRNPDYGQQAGGSVALVGAGPGDPDLLTLRALRVLQNADVVVHDKLVDDRILDYVRRDARRIFVGKTKANHALSQDGINQLLVREAQAGNRVVRLKGGDPFVFGRGGEEVEACRAAGIPVQVVPGITAALGCGAVSTIPVTHRDLAQGVTLVTGHGKGGSEPALDWQALVRLRHTLVIYMGLSAAGSISRNLTDAGLDPATPAALVEKGTRPDQVLAVGSVGRLAEMAAAHRMEGPALIIVGEVVRLADPALIADITRPALAVAAE